MLFLQRLKIFLPFRAKIISLFLLGLFSSAFFLSGPYFSKLFIDASFLKKDIHAFFKFTIIGGAIFLFSALTKVFSDVVKNRALTKAKLALAESFIRKFYSLDLAFFQAKSVGENIYRLGDIERVARFLLERLPNLGIDIAKFLIILGISLWVNFRMSLFMVILSPLFLLQGLYIRRKIKPIYQEIWKSYAELSKKLHEAFSRILIIKALGLESFTRRSYIRLLVRNIRLGLKSFRWSILNSLTSAFLSKSVFATLSLYGGWMIIKGNLSLGSYTAAMLYLTQIGALLQSLSSTFDYFVQDIICVERFFEIMEREPKIKDSPGAVTLSAIKGQIEFRNVCFAYQEERPVFKNMSFGIPTGKWIGIVGPSGSGKTTIISLILRLYDPSGGVVLIDGVDLQKIKLQSVRGMISIATQEPLLFDLSLKDNIAYGLKDISLRQIEEVASTVQLDDFVRQLPKKYDTVIGENACQLSQGYKQRVALARAIIRNPTLLILDEATSSVDSLTEEKIFRALREKRRGRSTLVISHRLFSVKDAEVIYFLRPQGLVEEGKHEDLLTKSPQYKEFFQNQLEGSEAELGIETP